MKKMHLCECKGEDGMWFREHTAATVACVYVAVLGTVAVLYERASVPSGSAMHAKVANASVAYAIGALLWPFAWSTVCGYVVDSMPWFAYIGVLWPPILLLADVAFAQHGVGQDPHRQTQGMSYDANTLSGLALTLGAVLVKTVSDGFATAAAPMMIATVLLGLLFIMPSMALHAESLHAATVRAVQKVALQYCLGFTLTAVSIAFAVGLGRAPAQGPELRKVIES